MKKNVLALSIATMIGGLGFAGAASAAALAGAAPLSPTTATDLRVSEGGFGHILLVPYFNAQNGNMTVFHMVNTDVVNGKAVKIRFRSAANSDDVLDFQVYLSPGDVWTGAVSQSASGVAQIVTGDNSCTVPQLQRNVPQTFVTDRLNKAISAADQANQTREGYVEIFAMADIPLPATPVAPAVAPALYTDIKHVNGVAPCSVAGSPARQRLDTIATTNYTTTTAAGGAGFDTPTGGLTGDYYIINVPQTTTFSGAATSIVATTDTGVSARGNFVHFPQTATAIDAADVSRFTADPLFRTDSQFGTNAGSGTGSPVTAAALAASFYDLPDLSTPYVTAPVGTAAPLAQAAQLSQSLSVTSVTNQYANDPTITAKTDWLFSMPTRRYSVAANYRAGATAVGVQPTLAQQVAAPEYRLFSDLPQAAGAPAGDYFTFANTAVQTATGNICVNSQGQSFYDREETTAGAATPGPVFSPGVPGQPTVTRFCGETSVLSFADAGFSVLGASVARQNVDSGSYINGWSRIDTTNGGPGLPIIGSAFMKLTNPNVGNGLSGTYGITWPHRVVRASAVAP